MSQMYKFKIKPYHHQVEALKKLLSTGFGGGLLMEPRTGKTKVTIDYACIQFVKERISRVVVFCPVGVIEVWKDQIAENCTVPHRVLIWDNKGRKTNALPKYGKPVLDFVIINYDALSTPGLPVKDRKTGKPRRDEDGQIKRSRRGGRFEVIKRIKLWQPDLIVLDESHRIKTPSAKKSFAIHSMSAPFRVICTGTPVTKSKRIFDIYSQWKFLNPNRFVDWQGDTLNFGEFKSRYGEFTERGMDGKPWDPRQKGPHFSQWTGNRNEDELHNLIHKDSYSVLRSECYDLPLSTEQVVHVGLDESAKAYDDMAEDMVARIKTGEITEASIRLVLRVRLSQISGGVAKTMPSAQHPKGRLVVVGSEKIRAITSRLEDLMEADEKVVIGAQFLADITRLEKATKALKVPVFTVRGGMHRDDREWAIKEFRRVSSGAVFIGQPAAASEGIDLSCASILQWYSLTDSWVHYRQFTDRIALSDRPTFIEYFLARGTVDELKYKTLKEDGDIGKLIITRPELLLRGRE